MGYFTIDDSVSSPLYSNFENIIDQTDHTVRNQTEKRMVNDSEDEIKYKKNRLPLDEDDMTLLKSPPYNELGESSVEENGSVSEKYSEHSPQVQCGDDNDFITAPAVFRYTHVPPKKRHYVGTSDSFKSFEWFENEHACIVCDIADSCVVPCSGNSCPLALHRTCADFGCEDPAMSYCPYCWFKDQATRSNALRTMVVAAAKALVLYGCSKAKSGDVIMARETIHLEDSSENSLSMQLLDNLDVLRELFEQVKAQNVQLEVDMEKADQRGICGEASVVVINDLPKRVLWTVEEEDMLRAGVEFFATRINKNMSWKKILEMGKGVFHKNRNPSDLKDKWKNMNRM